LLGDSTEGELASSLNSALTSRNAAAEKLSCFMTDDSQKGAAARLTQALAQWDSFQSTYSVPDKDGNVRIARALALDRIAGIKDLHVIRVFMEKAGGSLVVKKNLWTALGAAPAAISGGLIASYALTNPRSGELLASGAAICRTDVVNLKSVHKKVAPANCELIWGAAR
jgi:hypothetical protein